MKKFKELEQPVIFFGNPRSGTSVISEIAMRHKDIGYPSQYQNGLPKITSINYFRRFFDNRFWRIHGQKKQLNKVDFFSRITFRTGENYTVWKEITENHIDFSRGFLLDTKASPESIDFIRNYFKKVVRGQGKRRLAFKITGPSRLEYLLSIFPDAKLIRIHRKPIPTISSLLKIGFWPERGYKQLWWTGAYSEEEKKWAEAHKTDKVAMTAFQTKKIVEVTDEEIKKLGAKVHDVQYSDFIEDPSKVIAGILDYAGLSQDQACFDYFKKNKIYNQNKKPEDYFSTEDLNTIRTIYDS